MAGSGISGDFYSNKLQYITIILDKAINYQSSRCNSKQIATNTVFKAAITMMFHFVGF